MSRSIILIRLFYCLVAKCCDCDQWPDIAVTFDLVQQNSDETVLQLAMLISEPFTHIDVSAASIKWLPVNKNYGKRSLIA